MPCLGSLLHVLDIRDAGIDLKELALHFQSNARDADAKVLHISSANLPKGDTNEVVSLLSEQAHDDEGAREEYTCTHQSNSSHCSTSYSGVQNKADNEEVQLSASSTDGRNSEVR